MNNINIPIGIDRRLQISWLESAAGMAIAGAPAKEIASTLHQMLESKLSSGEGGRGSLEKTVTNLMRIWVTVPRELQPLRNDGLKLLQSASAEDKLAAHWGMTISVYPFWGVVADITGRLLRLQGSATMAQILLRVKEQLGERQTAIRSAQRAVRSFIDWKVLKDTEDKGIYSIAAPHSIGDYAIAGWLIEAAFRSSGARSAPVKSVINSATIFPFKIDIPVSPRLMTNRLELYRQGLDEDMVILKHNKL